MVLRRPPRPPLPPSAHDVLREARLLRALADTPARVPPVLAVCDDAETIGCPFYVMERIAGEVIVTSIPDALDTPAERRRIADELIDALGGDPRRGLAGRRAGGLRQADRLPGAPAAPLHRPVGAEQDARDPGGRARRRLAGAEHARVRAGDDRARRLSPGQHDLRRRRAGAPGGGARLGDGDDRRPAGRHRLPVHDVDRARRPRQAACARRSAASRAARAFPRAKS